MLSRALLTLAPLAAAALALGACDASTRPRGDKGVCYSLVRQEGGALKYNEVARDVTSMEQCAVYLENIRRRFAAMGLNRSSTLGAYQAQFLFIDGRGVYLSKTMEGPRFAALRRRSDGQLSIPGAKREP